VGDARGFSPEFVEAFRLLFDGRRDAHGEGKGLCVEAPVTNDLIRGHLEGRRRIGIYPIAGVARDQVKWGCLDLDVHDFELACMLDDRAKQHYQLEALLEKTKGKGWHLWFLFVGWVEAWKVRLVLKQIVEDMGDISDRLGKTATGAILHPIEINPKQPKVAPGGFGNYVNLPFFGADVANGRTCFYRRGSDGKPVLIEAWTPAQAPLNGEAALNEFVELTNAKPCSETTVRDYEPISNAITDTGTRRYSDILPCAQRVLKDGVGQGGRGIWAFRLPIHLKYMRWSEEQAQGLMESWNQRNAPPLEIKELRPHVHRAYAPEQKNESFGCEDPVVAQYCVLHECPVYRKNHPQPNEAAPDAPTPIDPSVVREINFKPETLEFIFARGDMTYRVNGIDNRGRRAQARASITVHRAGKLVTSREINLESEQARKTLDKTVWEQTDKKVTGVSNDVMNISHLIHERLVTMVKEQAEESQSARQVVLTEKDMVDATAWAKAHPNILYDVIEFTSRFGIAKEKNNKAALYLVFTSRLMEKPVCAIGKGDSSAGKSYVAAAILKLMPEEDVVEFTRITAAALFYRGEFSMRWKILFIREAPGGEDAEHSLRTFMSEGDLILSTVQKDEHSGKNRTEDIRIRGPICFYTTTTQVEVNAENETRLFTVTADETEIMSYKINETTAYKAQFGSIDPAPEELKRWRDFQRMLKRGQEIVIPYAISLVKDFPIQNIRSRRDFFRFLELIKACAFVHQFHRSKSQVVDAAGQPKEIIHASVADYEIVKRLVQESIMRTSRGIKPGQEAFLVAIDAITKTALEQDAIGKSYPHTTIERITGHEDDGGNVPVGDPVVWIESSALRKYLGKTQAAITRLIRALEADGVLVVLPKKTPLRVRAAEGLGGVDEILRLPTIEPKELYEKYPDDRQHSYDPLAAPDFDDIYGDTVTGWKRLQNPEEKAP